MHNNIYFTPQGVHTEDITSLSFCKPHWLATASFDGKVSRLVGCLDDVTTKPITEAS